MTDTATPADGVDEAGRLATGVVVRTTGSWHDVASGGEVIACRVPGKGRLKDQTSTNPVAVGDVVDFLLNEDETGRIVLLHPRYNKLSRRAAGRRSNLEHVIAANVDRVWIVQSAKLPKFNSGFVDRLLVMAAAGGVSAGLIINKIDLVEDDELESIIEFWAGLYAGIGVPVLKTCAISGEGVETVRAALEGHTSVISGPSGVGKSSLLNALDEHLHIRTAEVSEKTRKGRHTTAVAVRYELSPETYLIDTPGIREIGLWNLSPQDLAGYFGEMFEPSNDCKFPNCTHDHEPGCAVLEAVERGAVSEVRYLSYLNMLKSLRLGRYDVGR